MPSASNAEVLLVEDNAHDAEMTVWALEKSNVAATIRRVKDGTEALEYLFGGARGPGRPRVVLLDVKLPKVDGIEVLRKLKSDGATREIPVVMLTSSNEARDRQASYDLGVNSYVVKPVDFDEFVKAIGQVGNYWVSLNRPSD